MKKAISLVVACLLCVSLVGCGNRINNDKTTENITSSSTTKSGKKTTLSTSSGVTSRDVLDKVNECADFYDFPAVSNYKETFTEGFKSFTFSYALSQFPNDSFGVIGMEDEKGISALHTTFIYNNTKLTGTIILGFSYMPAMSIYCPETSVEKAIEKIDIAFQSGTKEENNRFFVSGEYEYSLHIGEQFMTVSVIRSDTKN